MIDVKTIYFDSDADGKTNMAGMIDDLVRTLEKDNWHQIGLFSYYNKHSSKARKRPTWTSMIHFFKYQ
jgi:hypothetical protein